MDWSRIFPLTSRINERGHLEIAGLDVVDLAEEYGTPVIIYDEEHVRRKIREYIEAFDRLGVRSMVAYAGKAFLCLYMAKIAAEEGAYLDCVTGGEIFTALKAGFKPEKIFFHGNNKSEDELELAVKSGVGFIVLDSFSEIEKLTLLLKKLGKTQKVLIRVTPGIVPKTHTYIQTGQVDSKFGFSLATGAAYEAAVEVLNNSHLELHGFHVHIGSQIFSLEPFQASVRIMAEFCENVRRRTGFSPGIVNFGGGLGVAYRTCDNPPSVADFVKKIVDSVNREFTERGLDVPVIAVEPGRSIVGNAAVTVYRIGTVKEVVGIRFYVSVDGGMSDNLRPMLYGAVYEAFLANKMNAPAETSVTVAGKHCENGDILIRDANIPYPEIGDLLVVPVTGAYCYAMANNYNRQPRPAVLFVRNGKVKVAIRRETYEDLVRNEAL